MNKQYIFALAAIIIIIAIFAWVGIVSGNIVVETTAHVPMGEGNCCTTYQANKDCFDRCLNISINY